MRCLNDRDKLRYLKYVIYGKNLPEYPENLTDTNWLRHILIIVLAIVATIVGAYLPNLRIPILVTGAVFGCLIGFMRYRWNQPQYWGTIAVLFTILVPANILLGRRAAQFQPILMFGAALAELVVSAVIIIRICPEPDRH